MPGHSTVAARCAAIGSGIAQIIVDTSSVARGLRNARHEINAVNAELLAIRVSLDIAHDDFSISNTTLPMLLLEAASGFLDCCSTATEGLHKPIVRLAASQDRAGSWQLLKTDCLIKSKNDLEAVRCAMDVLLDFVELLTEPNPGSEMVSPNRRSFFDDTDPVVWHMFLEKLEVERTHINAISQGRLSALYVALDKLRRCASLQLEECSSPVDPIRPRLQPLPHFNSRKDSLRPPPLNPFADPQDKTLPALPTPLSVPGDIAAWIANVVAQAVHQSPGSPSFTLTDSRSSYAGTNSGDERVPSRETFYAESLLTTNTRSGTPDKLALSKRNNRHARVDSLRVDSLRIDSLKAELLRAETHGSGLPTQATLTMKEPKLPRSKLANSLYPIASTVISADERSIIYHQLTDDKIAVAKDTRRGLTKEQRSVIDSILKNATSETTHQEVEHILWEGADPNASDSVFGYVVIRAAHIFDSCMLRLLVDYGADITRTSHTRYYSALHAAVLGKQFNNVQYLVERGLSVDALNAQGETPLHLAARTPGCYEIAKWLLERGAEVNRKTDEGITPFQLTRATDDLDSKERSGMMELLLAQGADGNTGEKKTLSRGKGLSVLGLI